MKNQPKPKIAKRHLTSKQSNHQPKSTKLIPKPQISKAQNVKPNPDQTQISPNHQNTIKPTNTNQSKLKSTKIPFQHPKHPFSVKLTKITANIQTSKFQKQQNTKPPNNRNKTKQSKPGKPKNTPRPKNQAWNTQTTRKPSYTISNATAIPKIHPNHRKLTNSKPKSTTDKSHLKQRGNKSKYQISQTPRKPPQTRKSDQTPNPQ